MHITSIHPMQYSMAAWGKMAADEDSHLRLAKAALNTIKKVLPRTIWRSSKLTANGSRGKGTRDKDQES
jgi:hypothetical protein